MNKKIFVVVMLLAVSVLHAGIADNMIELRQQSERALSLFIVCDFDGAIRAAEESTALGNRIIYDLRAEARLADEEERPTSVSMKAEPERSRIFSTVRRHITEAIKYYIINRNDLSIPRIRAVMAIMAEMTETSRKIKNDISKESRDAAVAEFVSKNRDDVPKGTKGRSVGTVSMVITNVVQVYRTNIIVADERRAPDTVTGHTVTNMVTVSRTNLVPVYITNVRTVTNVITAKEHVTRIVSAGVTNEITTISTNVIYRIDPLQKRTYEGIIAVVSLIAFVAGTASILLLRALRMRKQRRKNISELL